MILLSLVAIMLFATGALILVIRRRVKEMRPIKGFSQEVIEELRRAASEWTSSPEVSYAPQPLWVLAGMYVNSLHRGWVAEELLAEAYRRNVPDVIGSMSSIRREQMRNHEKLSRLLVHTTVDRFGSFLSGDSGNLYFGEAAFCYRRGSDLLSNMNQCLRGGEFRGTF